MMLAKNEAQAKPFLPEKLKNTLPKPLSRLTLALYLQWQNVCWIKTCFYAFKVIS